MNPDDDTVLIIGGTSRDIPGSRKFACSLCGCEVWLAPAGQKIQAQGAGVLCLLCGLKMAAEKDMTYAVTLDTLKELDAWRKRN